MDGLGAAASADSITLLVAGGKWLVAIPNDYFPNND